MDLLFRPAGALLDRVGFRAKFWLVGLIALAPLAYLTAQLGADLRAGVATAARERAGLAYVRALEPLMLAVQEHRGLVNAALAGDASAPARARRARLNADAAVRAVDGVAASHGTTLGVAGRWEPIKARWDVLKEPADGRTPAASFHAHGALVAELLHFSEDLVDASTLVLDPEAATYYL